MKFVRFISTASLAMLLGTTSSVYAQKEQEQKGGGEQKPQHTQQPQRTQQAQHTQQPQRTEQVQHTQQPQRTQQVRQIQQPQRTQQAQQPQRTQQAQRTQQPQRTQQAQHSQHPQRTQQAQRQQPQRTQQAQQGQHRPQGQLTAGRIPDARFHSNFGRGHQFHMNRPVYYGGYSQFQYSGYWFDFNDPWPSDWQYSDDVYVDDEGNVYYLCNPRYPAIRLRISIAI